MNSAANEVKMRKVAVIAASVLMMVGSISIGHAGAKVGIDPGAPAADARQVAKKAPPPAKKAPAPAWRKDAPTTSSSSKDQGRQGIEANGAQAQGIAR